MSGEARAATSLADALWECMEARSDEKQARKAAAQPDSWDYFGHTYFEAIDRADKRLAVVLDELGIGGAA